MHRLITLIVLFTVMLPPGPAAVARDFATPPTSASGATMTIIVNSLTSPRGFAWADDGTLYLALAGNGGDARFPVVEGYTAENGLTSSIVSIANGCVTPVVQGLVSSLWEEMDWVWGAMDVAILNGERYVLLSGAGPSWVPPAARSGVYKINDDSTMTMIADVTTWLP